MIDFPEMAADDFPPPKPGSRAISVVLGKEKAPVRMMQQGKVPVRKRPASQPTARDLVGQRRAPIWLGSGTKYEVVPVPDIRQCMPDEQYDTTQVYALERLEAAARESEQAKKFVAAAECLAQVVNARQKLLPSDHRGVLLAAESACCRFNYWGMQCLAAGQYTASLQLLKKAEAMTDVETVPNYRRRVSLRAATFGNLCCYFRARSKLNQAIVFAEKAIRIEQRFKDAEDPARTRLNYSVLLSAMYRHEEAMEQIEAATAILREKFSAAGGESWGDGSPTGASVAQMLEESLMLVVAYHNLWVEQSRRSMWESAADSLLRAANLAKQSLGNEHPLTVKVEESLSSVKSSLPAKSPEQVYSPFSEDDVDLARYGVSAAPSARLPSLTPMPPSSTMTPLPMPPRPATVGAQAPMGHGPGIGVGRHRGTIVRPSSDHRSCDSPPRGGAQTARESRRTVVDDGVGIRPRSMHIHHEEPGAAPIHPAGRRSVSAHRHSLESRSATPFSARAPASARAGPAAPRPRNAEPRGTIRSASVMGQQSVDWPHGDAAEANHLPPRPATVAAHRPAHNEEDLDDGDLHSARSSPMGSETMDRSDWSRSTFLREARHQEAIRHARQSRIGPPLAQSVFEEQSLAMSRAKSPASPVEAREWHENLDDQWQEREVELRRCLAEAREPKFVPPVEAAEDEEQAEHEDHVDTEPPKPKLATLPPEVTEKMRRVAEVTTSKLSGVISPARMGQRTAQRCRLRLLEFAMAGHPAQAPHSPVRSEPSGKLPESGPAEVATTAYFMQTPAVTSAAERVQARHREHYNRAIMGDAHAQDALRRKKVAALTQARVSEEPVVRFLSPALGGLGDNKRREAYQIVHSARQIYKENGAAVCIQKCWRGYITRHTVQEEIARIANETATQLQSLFRRYLVIQNNRTRLKAAMLIQACWRRFFISRQHLHMFSCSRLVRRLVVGCSTRMRLYKLRRATILFQRLIRGHLTRTRLKRTRMMERRIQKVVRGTVWRRKLWRMKLAVSTIAARWRGCLMRSHMARKHAAATELQCMYRVWKARRRIKVMTAASRKMSSLWKAHYVIEMMQHSSKIKTIQAWFRGTLTRERLKRLPAAAIPIQRAWVDHWQRLKFRTRLAVCIDLQKEMRRHLAVRRVRDWINVVVNCQKIRRGFYWRRRLAHLDRRALDIQTAWRGAVARWQVKDMQVQACQIQRLVRGVSRAKRTSQRQAAATQIRAAWLGHRSRKRLDQVRRSCLFICRVQRGHRCRVGMQERSDAATKIQHCWQRHRASRKWQQRCNGAIKIQKTVRARLARKRYQRFRNNAVIAVQALWKSYVARRRFLTGKHLALSLQASWRGGKSRQFLASRHKAAISMQRAWRRFDNQQRFQEQRAHATRAQACILGIFTRRRMRQERKAATNIQRVIRGILSREREERLDAAWIITSWLKGRAARFRFLHRRAAAIRLQSFWRYRVARREFMKKLRCMRIIVPLVRSTKLIMDARKEACAALYIQKDWRRKASWIRLKRRHAAAVYIQQAARRWLACNKLAQWTNLSVKLQAHGRRKLAGNTMMRKRKLQSMVARLKRCSDARAFVKQIKDSSLMIGSTAEMHLALEDLTEQDIAAIQIQRIARGYLARRYVHKIRDVAPLAIQNYFRVKIAHEVVEELRAEVHQDQLKGKFYRELRRTQRQNRAATRIQRYVRMRQAWCLYQRRVLPAVVKIQASQRRHRALVKYQSTLSAIVRIQAAFRSHLTPPHRSKVRAACRIQRAFRRHRVRVFPEDNNYKVMVSACTKIQSAWRCRSLALLYKRKRAAARAIQAEARAYLGVKTHKRQIAAATKIQSVIVRPYFCKQVVHHRRRQLIKMQAFTRRVLMMKWLQRRRGATLKIQAAWKTLLCRQAVKYDWPEAATQIQAYVRMWHRQPDGPSPIAYRKREAAVKIQTQVRLFLTRQWYNKQREAACAIQRRVRYGRKQKAWPVVQWLVLALQRIWRARHSRVWTTEAFRQLRKVPGISRGAMWRSRISVERQGAAVTIQRMFRGCRSRWQQARVRRGVLKLQAWWRCHLAKARYERILVAKEKLRGLVFGWRFHKELSETMQINMKLRRVFKTYLPIARRRRVIKKLILLQRVERGVQSCNQLQHELTSAAVIQSWRRAMEGRERAEDRFRKLCYIQARWRGALQRPRYAQHRKKVARIQAAMRGWRDRREVMKWNSAALDIQRVYRASVNRRPEHQRSAAALKLGNHVRGWLAQLHYQRQQQSVKTIQRCWRKNRVRAWLTARRTATTKIAAMWRGVICSRRHRRVRKAGVRLVCASWMWRQMRLRRERIKAANLITASWRGYCVRMNYYHLRRSADKIRRWYRDQKVYHQTLDVVMVVFQELRNMQHEWLVRHAKIIQRNVRIWLRWRHGMYSFKKAVIALQSRYRKWGPTRYVAGVRQEVGTEVRRLPSQAVILLPDADGRPSKYRSFKKKKTIPLSRQQEEPSQAEFNVRSAAEQIQAFWKHRRQQRAVNKLQALVRGAAARRTARIRLNKLKTLQAVAGLRCAHIRFRKHKDRIVRIQARVRGMLVRRRRARELEAEEQEAAEEKEDGLGNFVMDSIMF